MINIKQLRRRALARTTVGLGAIAVAGALAVPLSLTGAAAASAAPVTSAANASNGSVSFNLVPSSAAIKACVPHLRGYVTITPGSQNDVMQIHLSGAPANAGFDLFVIQQPGKPFGLAWYTTDVDANSHGNAYARVQGIFDVGTFSVSQGGPTTTFAPTHQHHLGLWFDSPSLPFKLGCEPGATVPAVTPFNSEQHAGIQALNTAEFPVDNGPLAQLGN
jgi:hypothetical protein